MYLDSNQNTIAYDKQQNEVSNKTKHVRNISALETDRQNYL